MESRDSQEIAAEKLTIIEALRLLGVKGLDRVVAAKVNNENKDLSSLIETESHLEPIFIDQEEGLEILRHSASHVMAMAVKELFPGVKVTIGPAIENGFYYDFDFDRPFRDDDLPLIQAKMEEITKADYPFIRREVSFQEALQFFEAQGEDYKLELIRDLGAEKVSLYTQGSFTDLCRGPHVPSTGKIKAFNLTKVAGAYWRGDERRAMLSRIYGVVTFYSQFYLSRRGRHVVRQCDGTACHVRGASRLIDTAQHRLGILAGETTPDYRVTYEVVYCLGSCGLAPVAMIDDKVVGHLVPDATVEMLDKLA